LRNTELAIESLQRAVEISPDDVRGWAKTNPAFKAIQKDKRFQELIGNGVNRDSPQ
jgi:hypothetical protein